jgi:hypothetical protein
MSYLYLYLYPCLWKRATKSCRLRLKSTAISVNQWNLVENGSAVGSGNGRFRVFAVDVFRIDDVLTAGTIQR